MTATAAAKDYYKLSASGIGVVYSIYAAFSGAVGNSLFSIVIALLLFLSAAQLAPKQIVEKLRRFFYTSDNIARKFIVAIAVGGTALVIDIVYGLDFLQDWLDTWVKRLAPALILVSVCIYIASIVSKKIYRLSEINKDEFVKPYEISYYLLVFALVVSVTVFFIGVPIENHIPSSRQHGSLFAWSKDQLKAFSVFITICSVWNVGSLLCIISRYIEWAWMLNLKENNPKQEH